MGLSSRQVVRSFKAAGFFMIEPSAVKFIQEIVEAGLDDDDNDPHEIVGDLMEKLRDSLDDMQRSDMVTRTTIENIVMKQDIQDDDEFMEPVEAKDNVEDCPKAHKTTSAANFEVINAFHTPRLVYDTLRKQFHTENKEWCVLGAATDKIDMFIQRYNLIHQRVIRHELFRPQQLHHDSKRYELTLIESLIGKKGDKEYLLLAMLYDQGSQFVLEDRTGQVPVSFDELQSTDYTSFVLESCVLLVEGVFRDGLFFIHCLAQPLVEPRTKSLQILPDQPSISRSPSSPRFVLVSDVALDQPHVAAMLKGFLEELSNQDVVLCFLGVAPSEEFSSMLAKASLKHPCVLVPGAMHGVLPQPPPHPTWTSNPCRIQNGQEELVLFHYPIQQVLQQQQIVFPSSMTTTAKTTTTTTTEGDPKEHHARVAFHRLIKTLLNQGHMMPVSGVPVYWNYDHALRLYPLPSVLVLSGDGCNGDGMYEFYEGCTVIQLGSFSQGGNYATFQDREVQFFQFVGQP